MRDQLVLLGRIIASMRQTPLPFACLSGTDWQKAGVTHATAQLIRGLIDRRAAGSFILTEQGRAVLEALMLRAATRS
jgi:hypothetical protein